MAVSIVAGGLVVDGYTEMSRALAQQSPHKVTWRTPPALVRTFECDTLRGVNHLHAAGSKPRLGSVGNRNKDASIPQGVTTILPGFERQRFSKP